MNLLRKNILAILTISAVLSIASCKATLGIAREQGTIGVYPIVKKSYVDNKSFKESADLFDDTKIHTIRIKMSKSAIEEVLWPRERFENKQVYALADKVEIDGETIENVGIRFRGNFDYQKLSTKLSFNCTKLYTNYNNKFLHLTNQAKRKFKGVYKINLRASQNDPTIIREKVASYIFQKANATAPRVGFAKVYLNNKYYGFYLLVEQPDKTLAKSRFGKKKGDLFKGGYPALLKPGKTGGKSHFSAVGKSDIKNLTKVFNALKAASTKKEIRKVVDVDNVLNYLAAATLVGHWDSFIYNPNNDYIYVNNKGKMKIIAWDLDNTFGSGRGWNFPVLGTGVYKMYDNKNYKYLFDKILAVPEWRDAYTAKIQYLLDNYFNPQHLNAKIDDYKELIKMAVLNDERKGRDWGTFTFEEANTIWDEGFEQKPTIWRGRGFGGYTGGLKGWIAERAEEIQNEID